MRGIYFIDPAGANFKETIRNARKKLEVPIPAAMPLQDQGRTYKELVANLDAPKTKYACIVDADKSTRKRLEGTLHKNHEARIEERNHFSKPLQSCAQIHSNA